MQVVGLTAASRLLWAHIVAGMLIEKQRRQTCVRQVSLANAHLHFMTTFWGYESIRAIYESFHFFELDRAHHLFLD